MTIKINRNKLETFLSRTEGRIFTADFIKKDGTLRKLNCRKGVHSYTKGGVNKTVKDSNAYITLFDMQLRSYRTLNLSSVKEVRYQKNTYVIVD